MQAQGDGNKDIYEFDFFMEGVLLRVLQGDRDNRTGIRRKVKGDLGGKLAPVIVEAEKSPDRPYAS
jgi:hypothetical protein